MMSSFVGRVDFGGQYLPNFRQVAKTGGPWLTTPTQTALPFQGYRGVGLKDQSI